MSLILTLPHHEKLNTVGMDLNPPYQVRLNGEVIATHDTLTDAMEHYEQLLILVRQT